MERTCQDLKEQHVVVHIEFDREKQNLIAQIQDWNSHYKIVKVQLNKPSPILLVRMNKLKEFEELLLDNTLLKVHNQALGDRNPKWKE